MGADFLIALLEDNRSLFETNQYANLIILLAFSVGLGVWIRYLYINRKTKEFQNIMREAQGDNTYQTIESINRKVEESKLLKLHVHSWKNYYEYYRKASEQNDNFIPDPYEYFKREDLIQKVGHRKIIEAVPAIFVSLGILGTFIGIYIGIQDLGGTGSAAIESGINTLLDGMGIAFLSSIVGILSSLVFQFIDRMFFYKSLVNGVDQLRQTLDEVIPVESEGSLLQNLKEIQEQQMNELKSFFTDEFLERLTSGIADTLQDNLKPHLDDTQTKMQELVDKTADQQNEGMEQMVNQFVDSLNEATGDHMNNLSEAFNQSIKWQETIQVQMEKLVEEMEYAAENQTAMAQQTEGLTDKLSYYTENYMGYQDHLYNVSNQLEQTTSSFDGVVERVENVLTALGDRYNEIEEQLKTRMEEMTNSINMFKEQGQLLSDVQSDIQSTSDSLHYITNHVSEQTETLKEQHEISNQWTEKTQHLLEDVVEQSQVQEQSTEYINNIFNKIVNERDRIEDLRNKYEDTLEENISELKEYWQSNKQAMKDSNESIEELNNKLNSSIETFAQQMHSGLEHTFDQFDQELRKSVQHLSYGIDNLRTVVESMDNELNGVNNYINSLHETVRLTSSSQE